MFLNVKLSFKKLEYFVIYRTKYHQKIQKI